jgi:hypothetical protein
MKTEPIKTEDGKSVLWCGPASGTALLAQLATVDDLKACGFVRDYDHSQLRREPKKDTK